MKIGIIGAGNIGGTLARKFVAAGHSVKLAGAKGPDDIREEAEGIGATPATSKRAVLDVEAVILSIPFSKIPDVAHVFADLPADIVVIDTSNYYPQFGVSIAEVSAGKPEAIWSAEQLKRPVVKAFNATLAQTLAEGGKPSGSVGRIAIPVAGDDPRGKLIVQDLVGAVGFDAVDAGSLEDSWRQQPGTPAYCTDLSSPDLRTALVSAVKARAPRNRDALMAEFIGMDAPPSHATTVARNRELTASHCPSTSNRQR